MIVKREYPSYGHLLECGDTTIPEQFFKRGVIAASHNHHFLGDIGRWFMTRVAGLYVVDSTHVEIRPDFINSLSRAQASYELPAGRIEVCWEKKDSGYEVLVCCPENIACKAILPDGYNVVYRIQR